MAKATLYQKQYSRRMRRAIMLRKKADSKARLYAQRLLTALQDASLAARVMNQLNQTYNVDVSTKTLLTAELTRNLDLSLLSNALAGSTPGEELVLFNLVPDNGVGSELASNWLLDGLPEPLTPVDGGSGPAVTPPLAVTKLKAQLNVLGSYTVVVSATSPMGRYHLTNDLAPYAYDFENGHEMSFTLDDAKQGQTVTFTFTDAAGNQVVQALTMA
ncbi:hypothetical protein [Hymenobacter sp.]|jgi:hypothetical protein|uniref:hypothetical protein n=1 Tax=Hymenobacter sp. TaxID=1898978 RepID=UPI002EDB1271